MRARYVAPAVALPMLLPIDPSHPEPRKIARAVAALEAGEVIGYPTDTVYGLGCDLFSKKGVDRLYAIKGMPRSHPLAFICPDLADIARYAIVEKPVYRVLRHYLPGPYCFIVEATREVPKLVQTKRRTVGIRVPKNEIILALTRALGRPIISTTAQREGEDPFVDPDEIDDDFNGLSMVLDGGAGGMLPTTVIDLTKSPPEIIREGAGPIDDFG
jgi:tRNA threonylcarbamoyl adenosine modification protein (Sua5/YciO/YrdC/YwlC family)